MWLLHLVSRALYHIFVSMLGLRHFLPLKKETEVKRRPSLAVCLESHF